jgi:hypothetical protein
MCASPLADAYQLATCQGSTNALRDSAASVSAALRIIALAGNVLVLGNARRG